MNRCIFLDRDGVINVDHVDYSYNSENFFLIDGVIDALKKLKDAGYLLVIITNQSGISKGIYTYADVVRCHHYLQEQCDYQIDGFYYSPYSEKYTNSLSRKPGSLMFEKAIAKFDIDVSQSWMIGDKERDLIPAYKLSLKTILISDKEEGVKCEKRVGSLSEAAAEILGKRFKF
jgi:D-glycero-D-manno-heptose 1,7-bisphosphate phosphatase